MINPARIAKLISNDIHQKWRIFLLVIGLAFAIVAFYFFNSNFSILSFFGRQNTITGFSPFNSYMGNAPSKFHLDWFPQFLLFGCSILTSLAFSEYESNSDANFLLALPASTIEKWIAKVILVIIILPVVMIIGYLIFEQITFSWGDSHPLKQVYLGPFDPYLWKNITRIILIQCIVFLGATIFHKFSFFKIVLSIAFLFICYNFFQIVSLVIINENIDLTSGNNIAAYFSATDLISQSGYFISGHRSPFGPFLGISYMSLLSIAALISLIISFLKFSESES